MSESAENCIVSLFPNFSRWCPWEQSLACSVYADPAPTYERTIVYKALLKLGVRPRARVHTRSALNQKR